MGLREWVIKRTINNLLTIIAAVIFIFFLFRIPVFLLGVDPADLYLASAKMKPEELENLRRIYGIPGENAGFAEWADHFVKYIMNTLTFQFGLSFQTLRPVSFEIAQRLPNTLLLLGISTAISIVLSIYFGVMTASKHGSRTDVSVITVSLFLNVLPIFWLGMMALMIFGYYLDLFPVTGGSISYPPPTDPLMYTLDLLWHLTLPVAVLSIGGFGSLMLIMRNNVLGALTEDYIVTARAKGLGERTIMYRHALRNALLPLVTIIALSIAGLIGGAVFTETVFNWYGMGRFFFEAVTSQDYPVMQALTYIFAITTVLANFFADILHGVFDPRVKYD